MQILQIFGELSDLRLLWPDGVERHFPIEERNQIDKANGSQVELVSQFCSTFCQMQRKVPLRQAHSVALFLNRKNTLHHSHPSRHLPSQTLEQGLKYVQS